MSIKYYQLAKNEELPEEFCAIRDEGGEPNGYVFYVPESEVAKLRELVRFIMHQCNDGNPRCDECISWNDGECVALQRMRELGVEVDK